MRYWIVLITLFIIMLTPALVVMAQPPACEAGAACADHGQEMRVAALMNLALVALGGMVILLIAFGSPLWAWLRRKLC